MRVTVYHAGTFRAILNNLREAEPLVRYRGEYYRLLSREEGVAIWRREPSPWRWLCERVTDYEEYSLSRLAQGVVGADGVLRRRTTNVIPTQSGYRQRR